MSDLASLTNKNVYQSLRSTTAIATGWLCTVGGLVADVLQPIAPFAFYLFLASALGLIVLAALYLKGRKELLGAMTLTAIAVIVFGILCLLQSGGEPEDRGIVAATIPAVATLQESMGIIEQKLDDIKLDTQSIKASTERLESTTESIAASLEAMRESFGSGGIISSPDSPEEYYHNARLQELGGDYSAARRSYLEYFKSDLPILDPHLRFIAFLKVQEGTAGARETYNAVTQRNPGPMTEYARLLLLNVDQRKAGLLAYFQDNPSFAPAPYHLSLEFSELRLGSQTLADKRNEMTYLKLFQEADENGGLLRYLIDQSLAGEWRADAQVRRIALEKSLGNSLEKPVSLNWMAHNTGWNGNITIAEPATDIRWNIKGKSNPASTGSSGQNDPRTGRPAPRTFFTLPKNQNNATIEIRYTDLSGANQGPFEFTFTARKESEDGNRRILEMTTNNWLSFSEHNGKPMLYFTHLMTYRGALKKIEYGLNQDKPNKEFKFSPWKKPGIAPINERTRVLLSVPRSTRYVTAQLTYKNGEKSPVLRFDRG